MANFKSDLITAKDSVNISDKVVDGDRTGGLLLLATAVVTLSGSTATNDTIQLVDLPAGAVPVPQLSHVTASADPGTDLELNIGTSDDEDLLADGLVLSSGGQVAFTAGTMPAGAITPTRTVANTRVFATVTDADAVNASVKLVFTIAYRIKG